MGPLKNKTKQVDLPPDVRHARDVVLATQDGGGHHHQPLGVGGPLADGLQLLRQDADEAAPYPTLWRVVQGVGVGNEAVVQSAHRLVVSHAVVEVAAIVTVYGVTVHRNEAPVSLGQRLTL